MLLHLANIRSLMSQLDVDLRTMTSHLRHRYDLPTGRHRSVAREHPAVYGHSRDDTDRDVEVSPSPFGLPLLDELPELADPLVALAEADRLQVRAVLAVAELLEDQDQDRVVEGTGVGLEHWLAATARAPRLDRSTWIRAARLLLRLPGLREQVDRGNVSAGQLRGLTIALRGAPAEIDPSLDRWLADAAAHLASIDADPDVLVSQARDAIRELTTQLDHDEQDANLERQLVLQPRMDGTGGTFSGSEDAYGFALLEAATRPPRDEIDQPRARADRLQALLHGAGCGGDPSGCSPTGQRATPETASPDGAHADRDDPEATSPWDLGDDEFAIAYERAPRPELPERLRELAGNGGIRPPHVLVRAELSTLLDRDQLPTQLLVSLAGGRLHLTSTAARALIDAHGASLRLIITDHGRAVGVGQRTNRPTGWLTDIVYALHDTCTELLCRRPSTRADLDHATPWAPGPGQLARGRTDGDNLGPLCAHPNRNGRGGWHPSQQPDGTRIWRHHRTGLRITSVPATWRPPPRHPSRSSDDDPGNDPPDTERPSAAADPPDDDVPF